MGLRCFLPLPGYGAGNVIHRLFSSHSVLLIEHLAVWCVVGVGVGVDMIIVLTYLLKCLLTYLLFPFLLPFSSIFFCLNLCLHSLYSFLTSSLTPSLAYSILFFTTLDGRILVQAFIPFRSPERRNGATVIHC